MRSEVTVTFEGTAPVRIDLNKVQPMTQDAARAWLDQQFIELDCDPLRPTGKVLTADKVVVVAEAAGAPKFADEKWAQEFARATSSALGKPVVHIDVPSLSISY
jgi:hypothetical protein